MVRSTTSSPDSRSILRVRQSPGISSPQPRLPGRRGSIFLRSRFNFSDQRGYVDHECRIVSSGQWIHARSVWNQRWFRTLRHDSRTGSYRGYSLDGHFIEGISWIWSGNCHWSEYFRVRRSRVLHRNAGPACRLFAGERKRGSVRLPWRRNRALQRLRADGDQQCGEFRAQTFPATFLWRTSIPGRERRLLTFWRGDGTWGTVATSSAWSALTNPATSLSLTMGANTSTFNTTTAATQFFSWKNTTAAVVGTSRGSPVIAICGRAFDGPDVEDCMTFAELPGTETMQESPSQSATRDIYRSGYHKRSWSSANDQRRRSPFGDFLCWEHDESQRLREHGWNPRASHGYLHGIPIATSFDGSGRDSDSRMRNTFQWSLDLYIH